MTSTLTLTCTFCGLRFDSRPLLELHVRGGIMNTSTGPQKPSPHATSLAGPGGDGASRLLRGGTRIPCLPP